MILPFSTQMNGKPTYFVEKIHKGIRERLSLGVPIKPNNYSHQFYLDCHPKLHTMREDEKDRWKAGNKIDFFINCRQKDMFRFAPVLPVVSVQKVEIVWVELFGKKIAHVYIEDKFLGKVKFDNDLIVKGDMLQLAQNDGFDTIEDFFAYFNEDFKGKIIHWTDLKY